MDKIKSFPVEYDSFLELCKDILPDGYEESISVENVSGENVMVNFLKNYLTYKEVSLVNDGDGFEVFFTYLKDIDYDGLRKAYVERSKSDYLSILKRDYLTSPIAYFPRLFTRTGQPTLMEIEFECINKLKEDERRLDNEYAEADMLLNMSAPSEFVGYVVDDNVMFRYDGNNLVGGIITDSGRFISLVVKKDSNGKYGIDAYLYNELFDFVYSEDITKGPKFELVCSEIVNRMDELSKSGIKPDASKYFDFDDFLNINGIASNGLSVLAGIIRFKDSFERLMISDNKVLYRGKDV